ncbi:MAG: FadR family transcriptional regulator [Planctomycetes bacterium]|nr:FadR family transcriptional regulator [Planctomycetota bacterium]
MPDPERKTRSIISARLFRTSAKKTTSDAVVHKFKELLKSGELKAGDRIPNETVLAKSFGASRGSIREAVKMLVSFGILRVKWGDGTYVCDTIGDQVFDSSLFQLLLGPGDKKCLLELRLVMERGVMELAVDNAAPGDLDRIVHLHQALGEMILGGERDPAVLGEADGNFHLAIGEATHNPYIQKIYNFALELYYPSIVITQGNRHSLPELLQTQSVHQAMVDALLNRDKESAKQAVETSLQTWYDHL